MIDQIKAEVAAAEDALDVERWVKKMRKLGVFECWALPANRPQWISVSGELYDLLAERAESDRMGCDVAMLQWPKGAVLVFREVPIIIGDVYA